MQILHCRSFIQNYTDIRHAEWWTRKLLLVLKTEDKVTFASCICCPSCDVWKTLMTCKLCRRSCRDTQDPRCASLHVFLHCRHRLRCSRIWGRYICPIVSQSKSWWFFLFLGQWVRKWSPFDWRTQSLPGKHLIWRIFKRLIILNINNHTSKFC